MAAELFYGLLPEHLLLGLLLALMVLDMLAANPRAAGILVTTVLLAACAVLLQQTRRGTLRNLSPGEIRIDRYAVLAKLVLAGCTLLWMLLPPVRATFKSGFLACSSLLGAFVVMDSAGFIPLFLGIEMLSLPAFALMVTGAGATSASEAALKYLVLSSVATALLLFGVAFAYGATGTLAIDAFATAVGSGSAPAVAAGLLVTTGFVIKAAVFPFHGWAPDVYLGRAPACDELARFARQGRGDPRTRARVRRRRSRRRHRGHRRRAVSAVDLVREHHGDQAAEL